jgi:hypothetical protein
MEGKNDLNQLYVLRIWRGQATGALRITLKAVESGETHHFASMEAFSKFIKKKCYLLHLNDWQLTNDSKSKNKPNEWR